MDEIRPDAAIKPSRHGDQREIASAIPSVAKEHLDLVAELEREEHAKIGPLRHAIERVSNVCGTPGYFVLALAFIATWVLANLLARHAGWAHYDEPPFFWLQGIVSSNALLLTIAVLIRQDRMARLATHHAHLDLQINMLTEKKVTKALELIASSNRHSGEEAVEDDSVEELSRPADPEAIMAAIKGKVEAPAS